MTKVTINDWSGGLGEDIREFKTNTFAKSKNFDIKAYSNKIVPYNGILEQAQNGNTYSNGAVITTLSSGTQRLAFLGASDSTNYYPRFYGKADAALTSTVVGYTGGDPTTTGYKVAFGTLVSYKNKLICMGYSSTDVKMYSYDGATVTFATVGTISAYPTNISIPNIPKPFRHPADDILYCAAGNVVAANNNGSFTAAALTLPSDCWVTSLTDYGTYLAIATAPRNAGGRSRVFLWNRDTSQTTVSEVIDFGEGDLKVLENVGGALVGILIASSDYVIKKQLRLYLYTGGSPELVKNITGSEYSGTGEGTTQLRLNIFKAKKGEELYFSAEFPVGGELLNQIWVAGKNRSGQWYLSPDRYVNGTTDIDTINGFDFIGDHMFVGFDSGSFYRTYALGDMVDSSVYQQATLDTLINPKMFVEDRDKKKQLKSISLTTTEGGTFTVSYSVDGGEFVNILSETIAANTTKEAAREADGKPLKTGREFQFRLHVASQAVSTGEPDISEFAYKYDVINSINE